MEWRRFSQPLAVRSQLGRRELSAFASEAAALALNIKECAHTYLNGLTI